MTVALLMHAQGQDKVQQPGSMDAGYHAAQQTGIRQDRDKTKSIRKRETQDQAQDTSKHGVVESMGGNGG
jgi:hypothetical protein